MSGPLETEGSAARRAAETNPSLPSARKLLGYLGFLAVAFAVVAVFQAAVHGLAGLDGLYHFRQAESYARHGPFSTDFPWAYSVLARRRADIWYGFHLFLLPFTFLGEGSLVLKLAATVELVLTLAILRVILLRHGVAQASAWTFLLVLFAPTALYQLLQARPQVLSAGLLPLVMSTFLLGGPLGVFLAVAVATSVHLSFFWMLLLVILIAFVTKGISERHWPWRQVAAAAGGLLLGWAARPHPLGAAAIEYVQLVQLALLRRHQPGIRFGLELDPVSLPGLSLFFLPALLLLAVAVVLFVIAIGLKRVPLAPPQRTVLWCSLLLTLCFFALATFFARRAVVPWTGFSVVFVAVTFSSLVFSPQVRRAAFPTENVRVWLAVVVLGLGAWMSWTLVADFLVQKHWLAPPMDRYREAGLWLRAHARPDDVIANVHWDTFPELYFWNPRGRYVWGMDPVFTYAYDQSLFWKISHLANGEASARTWGTPGVGSGEGEEVYELFRRDLKARYVALQTGRVDALEGVLQADPRFTLRVAGPPLSVYEVRPEPAR